MRSRRLLLALLPATLVAATLLMPTTAQAAPEQLRLGDLPKGAAPSTPYVVDRTLVDGSVQVTLPRGVSGFVGKVGEDYLVHGYLQKQQREVVIRVTPLGARTTLATAISLSDATISPDGTSFVASNSTRDRRTVVKRYDAGTGDVARKSTLRGYFRVLAYDGVRAVLGDDTSTVSWDVETKGVSTLSSRWGYEADLANDLLASFTKDPYQGGCTVVSRLSKPSTVLWRSCEEAVDEFSTDGTHIATTHILADGLGPGRFTLRKVNGKKVGVFDAPYYFGKIWFEDGNTVLADTFAKTKGAVVRCDGDGCERATKVFGHAAPLRVAR